MGVAELSRCRTVRVARAGDRVADPVGLGRRVMRYWKNAVILAVAALLLLVAGFAVSGYLAEMLTER